MSEIHIPTRETNDEEEGVERVAVYHPDGVDLDRDPSWVDLPESVADELELEAGDKLTVTQKPFTHVDESRIGGNAAGDDGNLDPFPLLQELIDETVTDSNVSIHPASMDERKEYEQTLVQDMATPNLAWFLYKWLGANRIMHNLVNAGGEIEHRKKKS